MYSRWHDGGVASSAAEVNICNLVTCLYLPFNRIMCQCVFSIHGSLCHDHGAHMVMSKHVCVIVPKFFICDKI